MGEQFKQTPEGEDRQSTLSHHDAKTLQMLDLRRLLGLFRSAGLSKGVSNGSRRDCRKFLAGASTAALLDGYLIGDAGGLGGPCLPIAETAP